jgi:predicted dehydrogenase
MINLGVIGLGSNGYIHFQNSLRIPGVRVISVADKSKSSLRSAEKHGVKGLYEDYEKLLENSQNLDAVIISLPNFLHFPCIMRSLESDLDVFVEKPLANTVSECKLIKEKLRKTGKRLTIGHAMRFYDAIVKMKEKADRGEIGDLEFFTAESLMNGPLAHGATPRPVPEWWFNPELVGGGVLLDLGYHLIDLYHFFMGDSKLAYADLDYKYNLEVEDTAVIVLKKENKEKPSGFINVGWYQKSIFPEYNYRCIVHGDSGYLSAEKFLPTNMYLHAVREGLVNFVRRFTGREINPLSYTYFYESFYKELESFTSSLKNDEPMLVNVDDGIKTMEVIEQVYNKCKAD